jgi:hypothetical protein
VSAGRGQKRKSICSARRFDGIGQQGFTVPPGAVCRLRIHNAKFAWRAELLIVDSDGMNHPDHRRRSSSAILTGSSTRHCPTRMTSVAVAAQYVAFCPKAGI